MTIRKLAAYIIFGLLLSANFVAEAQTTIKIGALLHLSGEFAVQGVAFREGIELGSTEINAAGGIGGKLLEIVFEDTQYKPLQAVSGAKKLMQYDKVVAVLISTATEAKAAGTVLQKGRIPGLVLWDSSPEIEAIGDYIFGIGPWAPASGERSAEFALQRLKARKAVILSSNTEWSSYVSKYFENKFKALNGSIVAAYSSNPDELDFRSVLAKVKHLDPDVIYAPIDGNIIPFYTQMKQAGIRCPIVTSDIITEEYLITDPKVFEGVFQTMTFEADLPAYGELQKAYARHFKRELTQGSFVAWGFDAVKMLGHVIEESGTNPSEIKAAMHKLKDFSGSSGTFSMNGHGSAPRPIHIFRIQGKKFKLIEKN